MNPILPEGTVTFLFTDVEGSTRLWEQHPDEMRLALGRHDALLSERILRSGGLVVRSRGEGDSFFAVFARATDALAAACALQQALVAEAWSTPSPLRVRVALHTGEAELRDGDYFGSAVNRCARLRAVAHGGQVLLSLATQELVRDHLPEGVGLRDLGEHRLKDLTRRERVFQLVHPDLPSEFPLLTSLDSCPNNLPAQATALIGREHEVKAAQQLLRSEEIRMVTLTGPGGAGKTRLGLQVATELIHDFSDGVFFVALAPITDPGLVASAVAHALSVRETPGQPLRELLNGYLRDKRMLLLLDNFEQVLEAAPLVAELLAGAPRLKVLVTSRAVLSVRGEKEFPVPPLSLPDLKHLPPPPSLSQYAAVELFIQRALDVKPDFTVTNENAPAVAEICARLDGLPLAIELAAARVRVLTPQAMLTRLSSRLTLLTGGARDLPARQQTLRSAIAWSHDLLSEAQKTLFRRLSVFVGGCSLEAAEALCGAVGCQPSAVGGGMPVSTDSRQPMADSPLDVLDVVASLVDQNLLRQEERGSGEPRFMMLETIREYGLERLAESGDEAVLRRRHAELFLALAESAALELHGPDQAAWLHRLEIEHDNLRAALAWGLKAVDSGQWLGASDGTAGLAPDSDSGGLTTHPDSLTTAVEVGLRLAGALWWFWYLRGYFSEGQGWLKEVLALPAASRRSETRAKALEGAGGLALFRGDFPVALPLLEENVAIWRELGDKRGLAYALRGLGWLMMGLRDPAAAHPLMEESLDLYRELGDQQGVARSLNLMGTAACVAGNYAAARALWEESLALARGAGDQYLVAWVLYYLGMAAEHQRDYRAAHAFWVESLEIRGELGYKPGIAMSLEALARWFRVQGQAERAARLLGAAAALHDALGTLMLPDWLPEWHVDREGQMTALRTALGETGFAAAWTDGFAMGPEQAVVEALAAPDAI